MIGFYARGFANFVIAYEWARAWRKRHPRWSIVIGIAVLNAAFIVFSTSYAWAADGGGPLAPFLPGGTLHDSAGVAVVNYAVLPLDRGDAFTPLKGIPTTIVDIIWTYHLAFVAWMLWFLEWLLNFEWVSWLAIPFNELALTLQDLIGQVHWVPFALGLTGLVAGTALLAGKVSSGLLEMLMAAICVVLAAGILANPVASLTAAGGALDKAQEFSSEIASAVVTDRGEASPVDGEVLSEAVTTQLVDIFVRQGAQLITFGRVLQGECENVFNTAMETSAPILGGGNEVRDRVGECDPLAKFFVQNPNFTAVQAASTVALGGTILYGFALFAAGLLIFTVVSFLIAALKSMVNVFLGMLPINRYALWRSLGDVAMGVISIFVIVVAIAAYLKVVVDVLHFTGAIGLIAQMNILAILMLVLLIFLWQIRRKAKKAGRTIAEQLSKVGLNSGGPRQRDRALAAATMSTVVSSGMNLIGRRKLPAGNSVDARSINIFGTPGAAPALDDIGEMTAVQSPVTPAGGSRATKALPGGKTSSSSTAASTAGKTADLVFKAVNVAKAAPGGPAAMAGAAALEIGKDVAAKTANKAITAAAPPASEGHSTGQAANPTGRRIIVGSDGTGHIQRTKLQPVHDITTLPPTPTPTPTAAPRSPRNAELRELIASRKQLTT